MAAILAANEFSDKKESLPPAALAAAVEQGRENAGDERLTTIKTELHLIGRLAQDEPLDYGTQDLIGRAANRALAALGEFERTRTREAVALNLLFQELAA